MKSAACFLVALAAFAQTPAGRNTASISGVVVDQSGAPLKEAEVIIEPDLLSPDGVKNQVPSRKTRTDDQGKFLFDQLPPGRCILIARNLGYLDQPYGGPPNLNLMGTRIEVGQNEKLAGLRIVMAKAAILTGRVTSAATATNDEPVQGTIVYAARWTYTGGIRQLEGRGTRAVTDDRGTFRITDLEPGRYFIYTIPPPASGRVGDFMDTNRVALPTYAPNSLDLLGAVGVQLSSGTQAAIDVKLREDRQFTVRGKIIGLKEKSGATVLLMEDPYTPRPGTPKSPPAGFGPPYIAPFTTTANVDAAGNFELRGVLPGEHRLYAFGGAMDLNFGAKGYVKTAGSSSPNDGDMGTADITVKDQDLSDVSISLMPAGTITRKIETEKGTYGEMSLARVEGASKAPLPAAIRTRLMNSVPEITLIPENGVSSGGRFAGQFLTLPAGSAAANSGTQKVSPGRYWLDSPGYVKRVLLGEMDVTHQMITVTGATVDLKILFGDEAGQVKGTIVRPNGDPAPGGTVSAWPVIPDLSKQNQGAFIAQATQKGNFAQAVTPGDYYVAAFENLPDPGLAQYPDFLRSFTSSATRVHIDANGAPSVTLKLIPRSDADRVINQLPN